jgi:hypothetical protein
MEGDLLSLQISDQFFGPINRDLVVYREQYPSIPFNCLIDLDALVTHHNRLRSRAEVPDRLLSYDGGRALLFHRITVGYVGFGTMRPSCISWVTDVGCFGIELTSLDPLQSSTPWCFARIVPFAMASSSLAHTSGSYPLK